MSDVRKSFDRWTSASPARLKAAAVLALLVTSATAHGRELRDYSSFTQFSSGAVQTLSPSTELAMPTTLGETSRPLLAALQQRFYSLEGRATAPTTPFASFALAAAESEAAPLTSNVWVAGSQTWLRDNASLVDYAGDQSAVTVGGDHRFGPDVVLGLSVSREDMAISTYFNQGRLTSKGTTVSPYVVWTIGGPFSLDAAAAYTHSDIKQTYAPTVLSGGVHSGTDAHRGLLASNLNYTTFVDSWIVGGKVGTLLVSERVGSYTDSAGLAYSHQTNTLGQLQVGPNVGRIESWGSIGASAAYLYDYNHLETVTLPGGRPPHVDRDGVLLTGNLSANVWSGVALNFSVSREYLRDNLHNTNIAAMLAMSF